MNKKSIVLFIALLSVLVVTIGYAAIVSPSTIVLDSIAEEYQAVRFDHDMHAGIAENCVQCHHEHPVSDVLSCGRCHSITPQDYKKTVQNAFMPCRNCHDKLDQSDPGRPSLKVAYHRTCFECHRDLGHVGLDPKNCTNTCHDKK